MSLAYRLDGPEDARVLVLSSSLGTTAELWDAQLPELVNRFRVLRYDPPGHGKSSFEPGDSTVEGMAAGLVTLLDDLGLDRVSFCGLSLGGMVGMALALDAPDRVERLVLACTAAYLGPPEGWEKRARIVREEGLEAIAHSVVSRWFSEGFRAADPDTVARFRAMLVAIAPVGYAACCEALARWDARERIHAIAAPTLVVVGEDDPATTSEHARLITQEVAGSRIAFLPGAAHLANVEQPRAFTWALLDHLGQTPAAEAAA